MSFCDGGNFLQDLRCFFLIPVLMLIHSTWLIKSVRITRVGGSRMFCMSKKKIFLRVCTF